jgi:hypothetical protein
MKVLISFVVVLCLVGGATAANKTWTGAVDSNWFDPNNWNPAGVPTGGYDPCSGDVVHVNGKYDDVNVTNFPVINTTDPCAWCRKLQFGTIEDSGDAYLTLEAGGELTVRSYDTESGNQTIVLGKAHGTHGILNMTGGILNMTGYVVEVTEGEQFEIGGRGYGGDGTFNMTGGLLKNGYIALMVVSLIATSFL